jgi:iron complex outermembrane receptor protein
MREDLVRGYSWDSGYGFVTPRLGVSYDASPRVNLYASLSTAHSEPRFDDIWNPQDVYQNPAVLFEHYDPATRRLSDANARPERLRAAEAGVSVKSAKASLRANGYWMDFKDELVFAGGIDEDGLPITDNAARSLHRGVELELSLRLPGGLALTANGSASEDRLSDYVLRYGPSDADVVDYSGNRIALFPSRLARARVSRAFGPVTAAFGLRHVGRIFLDNSENERKNPSAREAPGYVTKTIEPFTLAEAELRLDLRRWLKRGARTTLLTLSADNLFDQRYEASGYVDDQPYFVPAATRNIYLGLRIGF